MAGTFTDTFNVFAVDMVEKMVGTERTTVYEKQFDEGNVVYKAVILVAPRLKSGCVNKTRL